MKRPLLFVVLLAAAPLATCAAEYQPPPAGPSANLREWSKLSPDPLSLPGALKLSGQTNRIGDNGSALTYNGVAVGGGGNQVWTNDNGVIAPSDGQSLGTNTFNFRARTPGGFQSQALVIGRNTEEIFNNYTYSINSYNDASAGEPPANGLLAGAIATNDWSGFEADTFIEASVVGEPTAYIGFATYDGATGNGQLVEIVTHTNSVVWTTETVATGSAVALTINNDKTLGAGDTMLAIQNNGTNKFTVGPTGLASAVGGFSSTDTTAAVNIAATGWTNTFGKNAVVYFDGISVTATVYNNAGTAIYTNATALGGGSILLQSSGKVILSGTSVVGRAAVF